MLIMMKTVTDIFTIPLSSPCFSRYNNPMQPMVQKKVVTAFIRHKDKVLLLKRSKKVKSYSGKWAGVSGYIENISPFDQALKEIYEETGLRKSQVVLVNSGKPFEVVDRKLATSWLVHPFLFETVAPDKIKLDWEHVQMQWVTPDMLLKLPTVPKLAEAYERCSSPQS